MSAEGERLKLLMVGPLPPPLGGTTVAFGSLVDDLASRCDLDVCVVNTCGVRGSGVAAPVALLKLSGQVGRGARWADAIALHASTTALHLTVPLVAQAAAAAGIPFLVRKFDGRDWLEYSLPRRAVIRAALGKAGLYLAETRELVERARAAGLVRVRWFPNTRAMPELPGSFTGDGDDGTPTSCSRFVYLGQIHRGKGILELVSAGERMREGVVVDIYGTLGRDIERDELEGLSRVRYRGAVEPSDVPDVLSGYDCLVLPSYHVGEGYPGVVLEAYAAGIPVIATRWRSLPEIVDDRTGVLVEPRDADSLLEAMRGLVGDPEAYTRLLRGVRERRQEFSKSVWNERFVDYCRELAA